ncbi:MAG: AAA family ATPase [Flavobacteriales bacterium]
MTTAARFVNSTNANIFLTGQAGTGKTTFLRDLAQKTYKRFVIVAPTGIAALNAKGVTIHSQFLLPFGTFIPINDPSGSVSDTGGFYTQNTLVRKNPLNAVRRQVLRDLDLLIIDEVSMLRADVLDAIDFRLKHARRNYNQPFGGVQVLMIGDLFQLPPIVRDHEWSVMSQYYPSAWFFHAQALRQSGYVYIELDKIFRQQDDAFIRILNNLRNNTPTPEDIEELNSHFVPEKEREQLNEVVTLTTHNYKADQMNSAALEALPSSLFTYTAEVDGDFPESMYPVEERIELKVDAQIMFIKNDTTDGAYFNGKLAKVVRLEPDRITVKMAGESKNYVLKKERWENRKYVLDPDTKELEEDIIGSFTQYPIKLAWAITVHKSQGLTFDKAIIDVGQAFAPGQVYVALSRLRSLDGLILGTHINTNVISSDQQVAAYSKSKEQQAPLGDLLGRGQRQYLETLLIKTFDFSDIINQIGTFKQAKESTMEFEDESMRQAMDLIREGLEKEVKNTQGFKSQLLRLLREDDRNKLMERIEKGSAYYSDLLRKSLRMLLVHQTEVSKFSKTKTYLSSLEEVDALLMKKLYEVASLKYVSECILSGKEIERQESSEQLIADRKKMMEEVEKEVNENPKFTKLKTGRKKKKKDGPSLKMEKGETYKVTLALINEGMSLDDVAEKRGMSLSTVEGHAAKLITSGDLKLDRFMAPAVAQDIAKVLAEKQTVTETHKHFKGKFSFGQIRMVQAVISGGK